MNSNFRRCIYVFESAGSRNIFLNLDFEIYFNYANVEQQCSDWHKELTSKCLCLFPMLGGFYILVLNNITSEVNQPPSVLQIKVVSLLDTIHIHFCVFP